MTGKLKLSGDLSKALALESVLKAAREKAEQEAGKRSYHTFAGDRRSYHTSTIQQCVLHLANTLIVSRICVGVILKKSPNSTYIYFRKYDFYETIPEVRERMAELANKRLCKDVKAIYFFDMLGKQIYLDYVHRVRQVK